MRFASSSYRNAGRMTVTRVAPSIVRQWRTGMKTPNFYETPIFNRGSCFLLVTMFRWDSGYVGKIGFFFNRSNDLTCISVSNLDGSFPFTSPPPKRNRVMFSKETGWWIIIPPLCIVQYRNY